MRSANMHNSEAYFQRLTNNFVTMDPMWYHCKSYLLKWKRKIIKRKGKISNGKCYSNEWIKRKNQKKWTKMLTLIGNFSCDGLSTWRLCTNYLLNIRYRYILGINIDWCWSTANADWYAIRSTWNLFISIIILILIYERIKSFIKMK